MAFFKEWVLNIITMVVLIVLLEILIPSGRMKKYVNLVSGLIIIIVIINPFVMLLSKNMEIKDFYIQNSNAMDRREIAEKSKVLEEQQMEQITEIYRNKIIKQIEDEIKDIKGVNSASADVIINEDYESELFGEIIRVYIYLKPQSSEDGIKPVTKVEKVVIGDDSEPPSKNFEEEKIDSSVKEKIINNVNKALGVDKEAIVISMQES